MMSTVNAAERILVTLLSVCGRFRVYTKLKFKLLLFLSKLQNMTEKLRNSKNALAVWNQYTLCVN